MNNLNDVHRLLDAIDIEIERLNGQTQKEIDVLKDAGELCLIVSELSGWFTAYSEEATKLGVSASLLSKFVKMRGRVQTRHALAMAERVRTYLRSQDQASGAAQPRKKSPAQIVSPAKFTFAAERWIAITSTCEIKGRIAVIAALLDNIIEQTSKSNLPPDQQILTEIERHQLIAILETALNILKSPLAEKSLLQKARDVLRKAASSAAEKGVQTGVGQLADLAVAKITELLQNIL